MNEIEVSIVCITYNHALFISKTLEGFVTQKCNFNFEVLIGEDYSHDNTLEICQRYAEDYPDIIRIINSDHNIGMIENLRQTSLLANGKYTAICEGDDYWTDTEKLQKQVNYLRENPDYKLVHTGKKVLIDGFEHDDQSYTVEKGFIFEAEVITNMITTLTVLAESEILKKAIQIVSSVAVENKWTMLDYPIWLEIAMHYKIGYLDDITGTYRVLPESASRSTNRLRSYLIDQSVLRVKKFYFSKYRKLNPDISIAFRNQFRLKIFHLRKRLILDYRWMALRDLPGLIFTNPAIYYHILTRKFRPEPETA